jgi:hypothetical protein
MRRRGLHDCHRVSRWATRRVLKPGGIRGERLATDVVAGGHARVWKLAAAPLYATTFDTISSQRVAQRLSLSPVASECSVRCQLIP